MVSKATKIGTLQGKHVSKASQDNGEAEGTSD